MAHRSIMTLSFPVYKVMPNEMITLPEAQITGVLNDEAKTSMGGKWERWVEAGFIMIRRNQFDLTYDEWNLIWRRYPGPANNENYFYTKDQAFKTVTTEQLREALKVLEVEKAFQTNNN
jgi:hypothetical protein